MKILILANNDVGLYKFRKELLETLLNKHEVYISLPAGIYIQELKNMGCHFIETEFDRHGTNPIQEFKQIGAYRKILKEVKPDIVFTYTIKPNVYGGMACSMQKIPYVVNITGLGTALENPGMMQKITLMLYKLGIRKAQKVFFQNTENREFMLGNNVIKGAYDLLPGSGVNVDYYQVLEYPDDETIDFVFIARVMKEKGIDQYLEAAEAIRSKYPSTRFHICGACEQDYEDKLQELQDRGVIIYHGLVKDMREIHKISSCTVHPTYYPEGLSNVLLESAASARPIITTNRAGCREVIDDGKNGFVVEQKNSKDLIDKIEKFLSLSHEERKQMGLNGRHKVEKDFNRQIVIDKYLEELRGI